MSNSQPPKTPPTPAPPDITPETIQEKIDAETRAIEDPLEKAWALRTLLDETPDADVTRRELLATEVRQALEKSPEADNDEIEKHVREIQRKCRLSLLRRAAAETLQARARAALEAIEEMRPGVDRIDNLRDLRDALVALAE